MEKEITVTRHHFLVYMMGREWKHETINSTNFNTPYTKLIIGGFIQTPLMLNMLDNREQNQSVCYPISPLFFVNLVSRNMVRQQKSHQPLNNKNSFPLSSLSTFFILTKYLNHPSSTSFNEVRLHFIYFAP